MKRRCSVSQCSRQSDWAPISS